MNNNTGLSGSRILVSIAAFFIVVAGLKEASNIFIPFMFAFFLSIIAGPVVLWLKKRHVPTVISVFLVTAFTASALIGITVLATKSVNTFTASFPAYRGNIDNVAQQIDQFLIDKGVESGIKAVIGNMNLNYIFDTIANTLKGVLTLLSSALLMLIIMIFVMLETASFPKKLKAALKGTVDTTRFATITIDVQKYLAIKTFTSALTGLSVGVFVWIMGLEFEILWGLIAFILNFIPFIGSIIAAIPAILLSLATDGITDASILALGYIVINNVISNLIEPIFLGRRLGLSPLIVFLSLVFWGYVWGPAGMFISIPLTMLVKILLEHSTDFSWVAILMGRGGDLKNEES